MKLKSEISFGSHEGINSEGVIDTPFDPEVWPADYGDPTAEYEATQHAAGLINIPFAAVLTVKGPNAIQFINGLVTNDIKALEPGNGTVAAFLDVHGKVQALTRIYRTHSPEVEFLLELEQINRDKIFRNLSRFVLAGGFFVDDISPRVSIVTVQGPRAASLIERLSDDALDTSPFSHSLRRMDGIEARVASIRRCSSQGFDILVSRDQVEELRINLVKSGQVLGIIPAGSTAFHTARIEAGIPKEPEDITPENILLETGLDKAVSYTKGCYLGQEIIARIHWRGQPARRLCQLKIDATEVPSRGTELFSFEGRKIGSITSSVRSARFQSIIALGYVHRYHVASGTRFNLRADETVFGEAEVIQPVS